MANKAKTKKKGWLMYDCAGLHSYHVRQISHLLFLFFWMYPSSGYTPLEWYQNSVISILFIPLIVIPLLISNILLLLFCFSSIVWLYCRWQCSLIFLITLMVVNKRLNLLSINLSTQNYRLELILNQYRENVNTLTN